MAESNAPKPITDREAPYTARKPKSTPSEPQMNLDQVPAQSDKPNPSKAREGEQLKKADDSHPRQDNVRTTYDSHQQHGGRGINYADSHAKSNIVKSSGVASIEHSPIHPRTGGRGSSSQPSSSDSLQGTSSRPRHRPNPRSASNHMGGGPTVPEFGAWNKDPEQAEGYTDVFNQVLTEKKMPGHPTNATPPPRRIPNKQTEV